MTRPVKIERARKSGCPASSRVSAHVQSPRRTCSSSRRTSLCTSESRPPCPADPRRSGRIPGDKSRGFVQLKDRIPRFNIVAGDRVRITVGKPAEKFNSAEEGAASGWKIYTVADVDKVKNRVYLQGLTVRR